MPGRDPLADPEPLIRRVYLYVAYRLGEGPEAEDVTSEVFERALRYRESYDPRRGEPLAWLIGIARRRVDEWHRIPQLSAGQLPDQPSPENLEDRALERLRLQEALVALGERDRELIALRYGADFSARQIAEILDLEANAVDVALHRARERLRSILASDEPKAAGEARKRRG